MLKSLLSTLRQINKDKINSYISSVAYKVQNLFQTNIDVGLHHLHGSRFKESLFRFKLIQKFKKDSELVLYNIARCNFFLGKNKEALKFFGSRSDPLCKYYELRAKNNDSLIEIPISLIKEHREYLASQFVDMLVKNKYSAHIMIKDTVLAHTQSNPQLMSILELGCGTGIVGQCLKSCGIGSNITGVEVSSNMCDISRNCTLNQKPVYSQIVNYHPCEFIDTTQKKFGLIILNQVLDYTYQPKILIDKCFNKLVEGGILILVTLEGSKDMSFVESRDYYCYSTDFVHKLLENKNVLESYTFNIYSKTRGVLFICG